MCEECPFLKRVRGLRRQTPGTHHSSRCLPRPSSRPSRVGRGVSTNANHEQPRCSTSPEGCGTPASSKLSPVVMLPTVCHVPPKPLLARLPRAECHYGPWLRCPQWRNPSTLPGQCTPPRLVARPPVSHTFLGPSVPRIPPLVAGDPSAVPPLQSPWPGHGLFADSTQPLLAHG